MFFVCQSVNLQMELLFQLFNGVKFIFDGFINGRLSIDLFQTQTHRKFRNPRNC